MPAPETDDAPRDAAGAWMAWTAGAALAGVAGLALFLWGTRGGAILLDLIVAYCF